MPCFDGGDDSVRVRRPCEGLRVGVSLTDEAQGAGLRSRIGERASRNHALSKAQDAANHQKSKIRARVEHVFGVQQTSPGGRICSDDRYRTAKAKIGLQNLAHNIRRLVTLERMAVA
jgi:IS5 family transposase